ncbi:hypothetical protein V3481_012403 [Fusarium oxysporum f. sp. vasinfectum]
MSSITTTTTHQWDSKVHQPPVPGLEIWLLATYCFRTALTPVVHEYLKELATTFFLYVDDHHTASETFEDHLEFTLKYYLPRITWAPITDPIQRIKESFFEFRNQDKVPETISPEAGNKTRQTSVESNAAAALESICDSIQNNATSGADSTKQFHLATDASVDGTRGVLQLDDTPAGEDSTEKDFKNAGIIMWTWGRFNDADRQYMMPERDMLAVVRGSKESHWMIKHSSHPVIAYTDHKGMTNSMANRGHLHGKVSRWIGVLGSRNSNTGTGRVRAR